MTNPSPESNTRGIGSPTAPSAPNAIPAGYDELARKLVAGGIITDPWVDGRPRLSAEPIILSLADAKRLAKAGQAIAEVYNEAIYLVSEDETLLDEFFGLTPMQKAMFESSKLLWHGIARADVFFTNDGLAIAELNCDTPTGEPEAVVLGGIASAARPGFIDPNAHLEDAFVAMVESMMATLIGPSAAKTIGIVYPTEFTEDLGVIRLYKRWFEKRGYSIALGSPYNLVATEDDPTVRVFEQPVSMLFRHYKTDWWSDRASAWTDEDIADSAPLAEPLAVVLRAQAASKTVVVNPFGAVLAQNKRMMAFLWEHIHRFGSAAQDVIQSLVPYTSRLEALHPEQLRVERKDWVLKSDYGAEGEEVVIGRLVTNEEWDASLQLARKGRWIAQRYFEAVVDEAGRSTNWGVFLVGGEPAGLYARVQAGLTDANALSVPVLIQRG